MFKKLTFMLVLLMFIFSTIPAYAAGHGNTHVQNPIVYQSTITVDHHGGVYNVGFATIKFPRDFIDGNRLPVRIKVEISAVNGVPGIQFTPDIPAFRKDVTIIVHNYTGLLYDYTSRKNIFVHVDNQKFMVKHFSRYAFS